MIPRKTTPQPALIAGLILLVLPALCLADQPTQPATTSASATKPSTIYVIGQELASVTHSQITLNNQPLKYEATAGALTLKDDAGKPRASFFYVAYCKEDSQGVVIDPASRPLTFLFNGGPGAAAVWLHLGAVGPMGIALDDAGNPPSPPYKLAPNPQTWLDLTDLVFIDPVGTGYSRAADANKADDFYGVEKDVSSVAEFIRLYTTRNGRWLSPKFLAGESYGTTRAAALSEHLLDRTGIELNGIVFMSTVLDFQTLSFGPGNRGNGLPYALCLPSYTATAWYHHKLDFALQQDLAKSLDQAQGWALNEYTTALAAGDNLQGEARAAVVKKLAAFTGLSPDCIDRHNLRIDPGVFRKNLLIGSRKIVGRFDSRLTGDAADAAADEAEYDPGFSGFYSAYTANINDYLRRSLKFETDLTYETLVGLGSWNFDNGGHGFLDVAQSLRGAMLKNPRMKVFFASGYFDLATPYLGTDYTLSHMELPAELRANVSRSFFPAGHMMYHEKTSHEKLKADVAAFMAAAMKPK